MKKHLQNSLIKKTYPICLFFILSFINSTNCHSQFSFTVEGPVTITGSTFDITVGNFDNAGRKEAIVTHDQNYNNTTPSSSNIVSYMKYNTATSTWERTIIENTGGYASLGITSGDYNSDGNRDFAFTSNCNCNNYYLYKGNGTGGFINITPTFSGTRFSYDMVTGDLNNDNKPDIVTGGNTELSKFLNTSTGVNNFSFNKTSFIIASSDYSAYGYSLADFNGDGFNDIVAAVPAEAKVRVLLNNGAGGFNSAVYTDYNITGTSFSNIRGVATGDFNDDGYPDIVAASYNGNAIGVLLNSADGTGTFDPVMLYTVNTPKWVEVGDLNADGHLDIAVVASNILIFSGNGDGTFAATPYTYSSAGVNRLAISDIDNDGRDDIAAVMSNSFIVLINKSGSYDLAVTDYVCSGDSYTFPDGSSQSNITSQVIHVSHLFTVVNSYDSIITTTVNVKPVYNFSETATVCSGNAYTFPDGSTQSNITAQLIHTSNLLTTLLCDSIITTTVNVNPVYNLTETATICSGNAYTFPDGSTQSNVTAQVIHTSNLQTTLLCDSIIVTTVNVLNIVTSVSVTGFTLTADAVNASYQWLDCDNGGIEIIGAISQSFSPTLSGSYAVKVSQNTCIDTSFCTSIVITGIMENGLSLKAHLYPNPTDGIVNVVFDKVYSEIHIVIKDIIGRVLSMDNYLNTNMISMNLLQNTGIYFIEISAESEKVVFKILKK
ncbi:MAG: T9SS type A sorting domain-containing protein [Bacteroidales bacterium]